VGDSMSEELNEQQELDSYQVNQADIRDMKVANIDYSDVFQLQGEESGSDWALLNAHANFSHKEACEFIVYIGDGCDSLAIIEEVGYSDIFQKYCLEARELGFMYVCFYA